MFWQTRTLASFIAATVPVEQGKGNPLMDAAHAVGQPHDDKGERTRVNEPRKGSYEALMQAFQPR
jgi:hypothetical protein